MWQVCEEAEMCTTGIAGAGQACLEREHRQRREMRNSARKSGFSRAREALLYGTIRQEYLPVAAAKVIESGIARFVEEQPDTTATVDVQVADDGGCISRANWYIIGIHMH